MAAHELRWFGPLPDKGRFDHHPPARPAITSPTTASRTSPATTPAARGPTSFRPSDVRSWKPVRGGRRRGRARRPRAHRRRRAHPQRPRTHRAIARARRARPVRAADPRRHAPVHRPAPADATVGTQDPRPVPRSRRCALRPLDGGGPRSQSPCSNARRRGSRTPVCNCHAASTTRSAGISPASPPTLSTPTSSRRSHARRLGSSPCTGRSGQQGKRALGERIEQLQLLRAVSIAARTGGPGGKGRRRTRGSVRAASHPLNSVFESALMTGQRRGRHLPGCSSACVPLSGGLRCQDRAVTSSRYGRDALGSDAGAVDLGEQDPLAVGRPTRLRRSGLTRPECVRRRPLPYSGTPQPQVTNGSPVILRAARRSARAGRAAGLALRRRGPRASARGCRLWPPGSAPAAAGPLR